MSIIVRSAAPPSGIDTAQLGFLSAHRLFAGLPQPALAGLAARSIERAYRKGHHVYYAGDPTSYVFVIKSGLVALTEMDERGNAYATMTYSPGDVLGIASVVFAIPHVITARAMADSQAVLVPGDAFRQLYLESPELAHQVTWEIYRILRRAEQATIRLARTPVHSRLGEFLLESANSAAESDSEPLAFDLVFSHQELAILLGTTRETISRMLARLIRTEVIAIDGRRVRVLKPDALRRLTEL